MRTEGWDDLYLKAYRQDTGYGSPERAMFEAGADAMLEGIMQFGYYKVDWSDNGWDIPEVHRGKKGKLVFIPEKNE